MLLASASRPCSRCISLPFARSAAAAAAAACHSTSSLSSSSASSIKQSRRLLSQLSPRQPLPPAHSPLRRVLSKVPPPLPSLRRSLATYEPQPQPPSSSAFAPPPPSSLPPPAPPKTYRRTRKYARRLLYLLLGATAVWALDTNFYASALTRSVRTFYTGLWLAADYKINFRPNPPLAPSIEALHARSAQRVFDLLSTNGGLYLKIGQAVAMQSAVLPPEFQKMFAKMFDDAPQNEWKDVEKVIREDFGGRSVEEVFGVSFDEGAEGKGVMERRARASASVAQVHWARLADGREVAIKVQKREIAKQVEWDMWTFKIVAWVQSKLFDLPFYSLVPYITERLMLETDFVNEADNGVRMAGLVAGEPRLRGRVYIPKVYRELSSKRVMTAEWIEGVRLWDKAALVGRWEGGRNKGSPGVHGAPLDTPSPAGKDATPHSPPNTTTTTTIAAAAAGTSSLQTPRLHPLDEKLKPPRDNWKGPTGKGGLGLSLAEVMTTMVDLFSAQMFLWGWVHCDPHPGNIFIRRLPSGHAELVLIDHGLYIHMSPQFRHQYATFWKALMTFDNATLKSVAGEWGVGNADLFASATLMRPYTGGDGSTSAAIHKLSKAEQGRRSYEAQQKMRQGMKAILSDEKKWPRELLFIGRNLRIVQGNNQFLGSPVNRVKITGLWASRALAESDFVGGADRWRNFAGHAVFRLVLFSSDLVFWFARLRQALGLGGGMEDEIEGQMRAMAKDMGVELNHSVFEG